MTKRQIRYTLIQHEVRDQFGIDNTEYCLVDLIDKMSNSIEFPECVLTQVAKGEWAGISNLKTLYNTEQKMVKLGLIEKSKTGCRTTSKWRKAVNFFEKESVKITDKQESNRQNLPTESVKVTDASVKITDPHYISLKLKKQNKSKNDVGGSRKRELQEPNSIVNRNEFIREYHRRKLQGWRAVCGADLICIAQGKIRVKIHSGEFVDYGDDLRKIQWKKAD